ncbi:HNH endonuclease [Succinivibrio dextrinosolvens]|uniref:RNA-guided endonuclease IscB n=1 Tax=Succinivibrio dextrinosolvens TaxID=83771 RepID=UPI0008E62D3A|nr:RNA-guided endonuclease IscB [Succinivibrio dextrinosolvens]SFS40511.1 HNH endonuclease [Succinivibrio dextrinosolvens]
MVYVLNCKGVPIMPTTRHGMVRRLLKEHKAKVVKRCPFTIQLSYECANITQPITLGVDTGYENVGISACTEKKVLFEAKAKIRTDIVKLLSARKEARRTRRNKKTRYRKARFLNRGIEKGWLPPSIRAKVESHLGLVAKAHEILPIGKIVVEIASFDIQKNKNPDIKGAEYQQGDQLGFKNVKAYVLARDGCTCRCCKGRSKDKILRVHHLESRLIGGDAPNNLVTLCNSCHTKFHKGLISLDDIKRGKSFKAETFMGLMRNFFFKEFCNKYPCVKSTYGYITKHLREKYHLKKDHHVDARCICGVPQALPSNVYLIKKVRCHNRQIHKCTTLKGARRRLNQAPYTVKGFRLFDKVKVGEQVGFIYGRRQSGSFDVRTVYGERINGSISYKKLQLIETRKSWLIERC